MPWPMHGPEPGAASDYATPAIDRLASEGIMLDTCEGICLPIATRCPTCSAIP